MNSETSKILKRKRLRRVYSIYATLKDLLVLEGGVFVVGPVLREAEKKLS